MNGLHFDNSIGDIVMGDRRYESLVLIHPDQGETGAKEVTARLRALLEEQGAVVSQVQDWGLRELAYPIAKQRRAAYVLFEYRASPQVLVEFERNLRLLDPVLRFVSVRQAENAPPAPSRLADRPKPDSRQESDVETEPGSDADEFGGEAMTEGEV